MLAASVVEVASFRTVDVVSSTAVDVVSARIVDVASARMVDVVSSEVVRLVVIGTEIETADELPLSDRLVTDGGRQGPASAPRKLTATTTTARIDRETILNLTNESDDR